MATNPTEAAGKTAGKGPSEAEAPAPAAAAAASGGLKPWLPLLVAVVAMPALAFATTKFVLLPKIERSLSVAPAATAAATPESAAGSGAKGDGKGVPGKTKVSVAMSKMLVNVAGTMGTRYLMTSVTLVGNTPDFKDKIEDNKDQLMDIANGVLSSKSIADLEKPGARNVIRAELTTVFNNALGGPLVQEIYITEMAIQ